MEIQPLKIFEATCSIEQWNESKGVIEDAVTNFRYLPTIYEIERLQVFSVEARGYVMRVESSYPNREVKIQVWDNDPTAVPDVASTMCYECLTCALYNHFLTAIGQPFVFLNRGDYERSSYTAHRLLATQLLKQELPRIPEWYKLSYE